jgi:hypothetical protein
MNTIKHSITASLLIFGLISSFSCNRKEEKCCACLKDQGSSDAYLYPLTPESPEWKNLKTGEEMYQVCQIPDGILKNMCTKGLIDTWMTYPLLLNIFAWENPQKGIDQIGNKFNGLPELYGRNDAGIELLTKYETTNPGGYDINWSSIQKGRFSIDLYVLELTISHPKVVSQFNNVQLNSLLNKSLLNRNVKMSDPLYNPLSDVSDLYLMSRVMITKGYKDFIDELSTDNDLKYFTETCVYRISSSSQDEEQIMRKVVSYTNLFVKK